MASVLQPLAGFDWSRVKWRAPDALVSDRCSYCDAKLPDLYDDEDDDFEDQDETDDDFGQQADVPLILWTEAGAMSLFCRDCQREWWGVK